MYEYLNINEKITSLKALSLLFTLFCCLLLKELLTHPGCVVVVESRAAAAQPEQNVFMVVSQSQSVKVGLSACEKAYITHTFYICMCVNAVKNPNINSSC